MLQNQFEVNLRKKAGSIRKTQHAIFGYVTAMDKFLIQGSRHEDLSGGARNSIKFEICPTMLG